MSTVVVTGANRGLGLELARVYAARGDTVIGGCRNPAAALELADAKLGSLEIGEDRRRPVEFLLEPAYRFDDLCMVRMGAVAHVDAEGIRAGLRQPSDHVGRGARRTEGGENTHLAAARNELAGVGFAGRHGWPNSHSRREFQPAVNGKS